MGHGVHGAVTKLEEGKKRSVSVINKEYIKINSVVTRVETNFDIEHKCSSHKKGDDVFGKICSHT